MIDQISEHNNEAPKQRKLLKLNKTSTTPRHTPTVAPEEGLRPGGRLSTPTFLPKPKETPLSNQLRSHTRTSAVRPGFAPLPPKSTPVPAPTTAPTSTQPRQSKHLHHASPLHSIPSVRHHNTVFTSRIQAPQSKPTTPKYVPPPVQKRTIRFSDSTPLVELASRMAIPAKKVLHKARQLNRRTELETPLDADTAALLVEEFGHEPRYAAMFDTELPTLADDNPTTRPPIITIAGHVDHGKTSILDAIRKTKITAGEHGGITQSIGAYEVTHTGKRITFLDTPGHFAFAKMRAHGIRITDIALLVVAADDSVQEQTIESIKHMQHANVPIILVINKIDVPGANPERVCHDLLQHGVIVDSLGGDVMRVEISAKTGQNIAGLLDTILLQAELLELQATQTGPARAIVLEAEPTKGLGPCATILLNRGQLSIGDHFVSGNVAGKVRIMTDDLGQRIKVAHVSQPVKIAGFEALPKPGDDFGVLPSESDVRRIVAARIGQKDVKNTISRLSNLAAHENTKVRIVIKAPSYGTLEALRGSLESIPYPNFEISIVGASVGPIDSSDVDLANVAGAEILGFQVSATTDAKNLMKAHNITHTLHNVIYRASEYLIDALKVRANQELLSTPVAEAEVIKIFDVPNIGCVIGCRVLSGELRANQLAAVHRKGGEIYRGAVSSVQRNNQVVSCGHAGEECGIMIKSGAGIVYKNIALKDRLKFYLTLADVEQMNAKGS
jgi:translation initiation factor IF-2